MYVCVGVLFPFYFPHSEQGREEDRLLDHLTDITDSPDYIDSRSSPGLLLLQKLQARAQDLATLYYI